MTTWAQSLIRIANYEVETRQKRLAEIASRRQDTEMKLTLMDARVEAERLTTSDDPHARLMLHAFLQGTRLRRFDVEGEISAISVEEEGARDALTLAYEELKKFEQVEENTRIQRLLAANKRETAAYDEIALRRKAS